MSMSAILRSVSLVSVSLPCFYRFRFRRRKGGGILRFLALCSEGISPEDDVLVFLEKGLWMPCGFFVLLDEDEYHFYLLDFRDRRIFWDVDELDGKGQGRRAESEDKF